MKTAILVVGIAAVLAASVAYAQISKSGTGPFIGVPSNNTGSVWVIDQSTGAARVCMYWAKPGGMEIGGTNCSGWIAP